MPGAREHEPHDAPSIVRAIPDPSAPRHLELPLLEGLATDHALSQLVPQPLLALVVTSRVAAQLLPAGLGRAGGVGAQLLPSISRLTCGETQLPVLCGGWRGDSLTATLRLA